MSRRREVARRSSDSRHLPEAGGRCMEKNTSSPRGGRRGVWSPQSLRGQRGGRPIVSGLQGPRSHGRVSLVVTSARQFARAGPAGVEKDVSSCGQGERICVGSRRSFARSLARARMERIKQDREANRLMCAFKIEFDSLQSRCLLSVLPLRLSLRCVARLILWIGTTGRDFVY